MRAQKRGQKVDVSNIFSQMYFFKLIASFTSYPEASSLLVQIVFSRVLSHSQGVYPSESPVTLSGE